MSTILVKQAWNLSHPPKGVSEVLDGLQGLAPIFVSLIRREMNLTSDSTWPMYMEVKNQAK